MPKLALGINDQNEYYHMLDCWQRIEQIIKWAGAASVSAFAREIGLNRSENLYQIRRGNNGISRELAESIAARYPEISKAWVLAGEGDMLPIKGAQKRFDIPFYKSDAEELAVAIIETTKKTLKSIENIKLDKRRGVQQNLPDILEPAYYISLPMFRGCTFASFTFSDAMHPDIPRGSTLLFEKTEISAITPGGTYLIVSDRFRGIRQLRKTPQSSKIRLVPKNTTDYDEVMIEEDEISLLYMVKGVIINI